MYLRSFPGVVHQATNVHRGALKGKCNQSNPLNEINDFLDSLYILGFIVLVGMHGLIKIKMSFGNEDL